MQQAEYSKEFKLLNDDFDRKYKMMEDKIS